MATRRRRRGTVARRKTRRGPSPALKKAQAQVQGLRSRIRNIRSNGTGVAAVQANTKVAAQTAAFVAGGGVAAGAVQAYYPNVAGMDTRLVGGLALIATGAMFLKGDVGAAAVCVGAGMLAGQLQDFTAETLIEAGATPMGG